MLLWNIAYSDHFFSHSGPLRSISCDTTMSLSCVRYVDDITLGSTASFTMLWPRSEGSSTLVDQTIPGMLLPGILYRQRVPRNVQYSYCSHRVRCMVCFLLDITSRALVRLKSAANLLLVAIIAPSGDKCGPPGESVVRRRWSFCF